MIIINITEQGNRQFSTIRLLQQVSTLSYFYTPHMLPALHIMESSLTDEFTASRGKAQQRLIRYHSLTQNAGYHQRLIIYHSLKQKYWILVTTYYTSQSHTETPDIINDLLYVTTLHRKLDIINNLLYLTASHKIA